MSESLDLLGDPIPEGFGGRGRPPHLATEKNRLKVRMLLALEWQQPEIAAALRVDPKTLRKHYSRELQRADEARSALEGELIFRTFEKANDGDASMMRLALKLFEKLDLKDLAEKIKRGPVAKKGKKEAAAEDALKAGAGSDWGDDLVPRRTHLDG